MQDEPPVDAMRMGYRPHQARFAYSGLAGDGHDLTMARGGATESLAEPIKFGLPTHESRESTRGGSREPRAVGAGAPHLVDLEPVLDALDGYRPERPHLDIALGEAQRVGSQQDRPGLG